MRLIKRQFGPYFAQLLSLSPSLQEDVKEMRRRGIRIRRLKGKSVAWCEPSRDVIYIGTKASYRHQLLYLAHELEHMLRGIPEAKRREAYIKRSLLEESNCVLAEIRVMDELMAHGIKFDWWAMLWYRRYKRGGRDALLNAIEKCNTAFDEPYRTLYGRYFDEAKAAEAISA